MEHIDITQGEIHSPHNWEFANAALLTTAPIADPSLIGKVALVLDTMTTYRLATVGPVTWAQIIGTPVGADMATQAELYVVASAAALDATAKANAAVSTASSDATTKADAAQAAAISAAALDATAKADAAQAASTPIAHAGATGAAHGGATALVAGFMSASDKSKLDGVATGANNYTHPATHPPSVIAQDESNRFVTDAEKATWNSKETGGAVVAHEAAADPHPQYTTAAEASAAAPVQSVAGKTGTVVVTKGDVGLGDVDNTSDANKPVSSAQQAALDAKEASANKGVAGGYAGLDAGGKVPAAQLPSFVDDVIEVGNFATLPATGESGKIYVTVADGKTWRWSGTAYAEISASPGSTDAVPEGVSNLYHTTARASAAAPVQSVAGKVGTVTLAKADVGLNAVDNTSDANKPVSTAQQTALNLKANLASPALTGTPTAPTATVGTNTTQLATTAFVASTKAEQRAIAATLKPSLSVDWTLKPTAAALTALGWTIARTGEITSFGMPTKAAENLFLRSADFANASWVKTNLASSSAVTDETGLVGVHVVANTTASVYHGVGQVVSSTNIGAATYRVRFLCKAAGYTKCAIGDLSNVRAGAAFDLATGATIGTGAGAGYVSHSITPHELGGGLYWCELAMTSNPAGTSWTSIVTGYPDSGATVAGAGAYYTGDGISGIEVYAAQLQQGFDGDYIPTTTDPITVYEPQLVTTAANELAYQHNASGECVGLVQYPADTNIILQSQDLSHASWVAGTVGVTASKRKWAGVVPFWRCRKTVSSISEVIYQRVIGLSIAAGTKYTATIALLADQRSNTTSASIGVYGLDNAAWGANGDSTAVVISGPGTATQNSGALWDITGLSTTVPTLLRITRTYPLAETRTGVYISPGGYTSTTIGAAILATRVHLSAAPRLMPYIPTTTAAVTRGAQTITFGGSAFAAVSNPAQGTLLVKANVEDAVFDVTRYLVQLQTGAAYNVSNRLGIASTTTSAIQAYAITFGVTQASDTNIGLISTTPQTIAYSFSSNSFTPAMNGVVDTTDTAAVVPVMDRLAMGWSSSFEAAHLIQRTELYPRAMTSAELAAITTPGVL